MTEQTIKYTKQGKKVAVLEQLNSSQSLVKEIYIINGKEAPWGEPFAVEALYDAPGRTWYETKIETLKSRQENLEKDCSQLKDKVDKTLREAHNKAKARADGLNCFARYANNEQLQRLYAFLTGETAYFFIDSEASPRIVTWEDHDLYDTDSGLGARKIQGVKLITLMGKSNGRLDFALNDYKDGSGRWHNIVPCKTYEEALAEAQESLNFRIKEGERIYVDKWEKIEGIQIPHHVYRERKHKELQSVKEQMQKRRRELDDLKERLYNLEHELVELDSNQ